jgi:hypothetical protein
VAQVERDLARLEEAGVNVSPSGGVRGDMHRRLNEASRGV